jgi:hypothetical protein
MSQLEYPTMVTLARSQQNSFAYGLSVLVLDGEQDNTDMIVTERKLKSAFGPVVLERWAI